MLPNLYQSGGSLVSWIVSQHLHTVMHLLRLDTKRAPVEMGPGAGGGIAPALLLGTKVEGVVGTPLGASFGAAFAVSTGLGTAEAGEPAGGLAAAEEGALIAAEAGALAAAEEGALVAADAGALAAALGAEAEVSTFSGCLGALTAACSRARQTDENQTPITGRHKSRSPALCLMYVYVKISMGSVPKTFNLCDMRSF